MPLSEATSGRNCTGKRTSCKGRFRYHQCGPRVVAVRSSPWSTACELLDAPSRLAGMDAPLQLLHEQQTRAYERYTYFLLATAAAAIAFAVQRTDQASLQYSQLPLAGAVAFWAASFWCGIKRLNSVENVRQANMEVIKLARLGQRMPGLESRMKEEIQRAHRFWESQFTFIARCGALRDLACHRNGASRCRALLSFISRRTTQKFERRLPPRDRSGDGWR